MYLSRYNSLCIPKYVSIQIHLAYKLFTLFTRTNTLVCINPDTTISVFLIIYRLYITCLRTLYSLHTRSNTLVCINPDSTLSVFLSMNQSRYNSLRNTCIYRMYRNETTVHIQLVYILGFIVHVNNMDLWVC